MSTSSGPITLVQYLIARLKELQTPFVQGVPGDYNLTFLSELNKAGLPWIGNANELNAAYSADGLARILGSKRPSVLVTTMGVGELSAANGVAGAYSERVPIVHIVGTPATSAQFAGKLLHHTLGDHKFDAFSQMARQITTVQLDFATLKREGRMQELQELGDSAADTAAGEDAARELDRVLEICVKQALPVYIAYPSDLVHFKLPASCRKRLTSMPLQLNIPSNEDDAEAYAIKEITQRVSAAKCPIILVDACTARHDVVGETRKFVEQSGLPVFSTTMGKTSVDESHENKQFGGTYIGSLSHEDIKEVIEEKADLVIAIGTLLSDFNTGSFTYRTKRESTIELHSDHTMIGFGTYEGVRMKHLIPKITDTLKKDKERRLQQTESLLRACRASFNNDLPKPDAEVATLSEELVRSLGGKEAVVKNVITQAHLWPRIGQFLRAGDKVLGETGTSSFGLMEVRFPQKAQFISQVLWGSIGYALPATLGVALGARQLAKEGKEISGGMSVPGGRAILFIGDGSLQLTVQEIGTMIRQGVAPLLFVINNDGYQIEREIYGKEEGYNDIQPYNHKLLLDAFQPPPDWRKPNNPSHAHDPRMSQTAYHAVHTKAELDRLLKDEEFNAAKKCTLIEVFVPRGDAPAALQRQAELSAKTNA